APHRGASWNLAQAIALGRSALATVGATELVAVGAATFGIPTASGIELAPAIPGWEHLALHDALVAAFDCPRVVVQTDVKAAAAAESRTGALAGAEPAIYLNLGTGLAAAIVSRGRVVHGAHGAAGEIGYNLRQQGPTGHIDAAPDDEARLEDVVSGMALASAGTRAMGRALSAADVFAGADSDASLASLLSGFVRELCYHLVNLCIAVDPARVAVGGGMTRSWSRLESPLRRALDAHVPYPPELVLAAYPLDAALIGATTLAIDQANSMDRTASRSSPNNLLT
ncbi:MAG TPA: ROK family protein, partial [Acidimicrobiales bacterium]|nr:ROK family protein [Acidimicrobiales bacterium]